MFYATLFAKHAALFKQLGVDPNNGFGDVEAKIGACRQTRRPPCEADLDARLRSAPELAMVNSDKGITNLHVPSDVIIDASMPAAIRDSGKMYGTRRQALRHEGDDPRPQLRRRVPGDDRVLQENGAFDPATMGSCPTSA